MKVETKYFGMIADRLNCSSEKIEIDGSTELRLFFEGLHPELKALNYKIAVNQELTESLPDGEIKEIALLPPFAGG